LQYYFEKVYEKALVKTHLDLEEASYEYWHKDRYVCIGDSIHKMTPNAGQGGNSAIESVATLSYHLSALLRHTSCPKTENLKQLPSVMTEVSSPTSPKNSQFSE
ncbi:monooxygenase, partial [Penicillium waksmanii]|uniref:monooxygenase n=1 Tax=Penicillium waksmanii TaxID=69791 RepID=UPI0025497638